SSKIGMNRTGADSSPLLSAEMKEKVAELTSQFMPRGTDQAIADNRIRYRSESGGLVGHVPIPASLKGVASSLTTPGATLLIDKLGERMAFERTGIRLYDALIAKHRSAKPGTGIPPIEELNK